MMERLESRVVKLSEWGDRRGEGGGELETN